MAFSAGDVFTATARMDLFNGQSAIQNVFTFNVISGSGSDQDAMDDIAAQLDTMYGTINSYIANDVSYNDILVYDAGHERPVGTVSWPSKTVGASVGDVLPGGVAAVITFRTGKNRTFGRKYLGGLTESESNDGALSSPLQTALANFAAYMLTGFVGGTSGADWLPIILDKNSVVWPLTEALVRDIWGYQRRRKPGVGV